MIATAAVQEDVDVVGLSILSGAHMTLFPRVLELLAPRAATTSSSPAAASSRARTWTRCRRWARAGCSARARRRPTSIEYIKAWFAERAAQEA